MAQFGPYRLNNPFQSILIDKNIGSHPLNWYSYRHFDKVVTRRSQGLYKIVIVKLLKVYFMIRRRSLKTYVFTENKVKKVNGKDLKLSQRIFLRRPWDYDHYRRNLSLEITFF